MIAVVGVIRSPLTAMASAPTCQSSSTRRPDVARPDEVVRRAAVRWHRVLRVLELEDDAGPGQGDQAGRVPGAVSSALSWRTRSAEPRAARLDDLDLGAQVEDPVLEVVLLGLQTRRGLEQRRPLLGRVADARALRGELGGDEEAEGQQGRTKGHLPAGDRLEPSDGGHGCAGGSGGCGGVRGSAAGTVGPVGVGGRLDGRGRRQWRRGRWTGPGVIGRHLRRQRRPRVGGSGLWRRPRVERGWRWRSGGEVVQPEAGPRSRSGVLRRRLARTTAAAMISTTPTTIGAHGRATAR